MAQSIEAAMSNLTLDKRSRTISQSSTRDRRDSGFKEQSSDQDAQQLVNQPLTAPRPALYLNFHNHKKLSAFTINSDGQRTPEVKHIYLHLPEHRDHLDINLNHGYEEATIFEERMAYRLFLNVKRDAFYNYLLDSGMVKGPPSVNRNVFLAPAELFSTLLTAPYNTESRWQLSAAKFRGHIFLKLNTVRIEKNDYQPSKRAERSGRFSNLSSRDSNSRGGYQNYYSNSRDPNDKSFLLLLNYHRHKLVDMVTSREKFEPSGLMARKSERVFHQTSRNQQVFQTDFAMSHRLVSQVTVEAVDAYTDDNIVDIRLIKTVRNEHDRRVMFAEKMLNWWAKATIPGTSKIVYGKRRLVPNYGNWGERTGQTTAFLESVHEEKTINFPGLCRSHWKPEVCYEFLDRLLNFVAGEMNKTGHGGGGDYPLGDPHDVTHFNWDMETDRIHSMKTFMSEDHFIPEWFIKQANSNH